MKSLFVLDHILVSYDESAQCRWSFQIISARAAASWFLDEATLGGSTHTFLVYAGEASLAKVRLSNYCPYVFI